eukprot:2949961-Amphidinium_carterae.1
MLQLLTVQNYKTQAMIGVLPAQPKSFDTRQCMQFVEHGAKFATHVLPCIASCPAMRFNPHGAGGCRWIGAAKSEHLNLCCELSVTSKLHATTQRVSQPPH